MSMSFSEFGPFHTFNPTSKSTTEFEKESVQGCPLKGNFYMKDTKNLYGLSNYKIELVIGPVLKIVRKGLGN